VPPFFCNAWRSCFFIVWHSQHTTSIEFHADVSRSGRPLLPPFQRLRFVCFGEQELTYNSDFSPSRESLTLLLCNSPTRMFSLYSFALATAIHLFDDFEPVHRLDAPFSDRPPGFAGCPTSLWRLPLCIPRLHHCDILIEPFSIANDERPKIRTRSPSYHFSHVDAGPPYPPILCVVATRPHFRMLGRFLITLERHRFFLSAAILVFPSVVLSRSRLLFPIASLRRELASFTLRRLCVRPPAGRGSSLERSFSTSSVKRDDDALPTLPLNRVIVQNFGARPWADLTFNPLLTDTAEMAHSP